MTKKLSVGLAISVLLSSSFSNLALADDAASALERQIMNGEASPSAGNPDNFPWMNKDGSVKPAPKTEGAAARPSTPASPPRESSASTASPPRESSASTASASPPPPPAEEPKVGTTKPDAALKDEKLKLERAEVARPEAERAKSPEGKEKTGEHRGSVERTSELQPEKPAKAAELQPEKPGKAIELQSEKPVARAAESTTARKPNMLFGRIEQLSSGAGASFPILKAQTAQMDPRGTPMLTGKATDTRLAGSVVKSFPVNYQGGWGGRLVLQQVQVDPNYYRIDPEEARRTVQAMKPGLVGQVNFNFDRSGGGITLEPARCLFMVPAGDTQVPDEMKKMLGGAAGGGAFGGMMSQVVSSMNVPIVLEFGDVQTGAGETSVSGNQMRQRVIKNEVRQLAANVLEQQIVTQETTWDKRTHVARTGYGESVVRFTRQSPTVLYVQAATVSYDAQKKFLEKMVLYGSIGKGVVMNTDPMQAMQSSMPGGMGGMGGMGGLGALQNMFGGGGGASQTPQMPAGGLDGMLKNLFGGQ